MPHFYQYARIMLTKNIAYYAGGSARIIAASLNSDQYMCYIEPNGDQYMCYIDTPQTVPLICKART